MSFMGKTNERDIAKITGAKSGLSEEFRQRNFAPSSCTSNQLNFEPISYKDSVRELHKFLEVKTDFRKWFPRMCEYGFSEETDFAKLPAQKRATNNPKNPWTEITDYVLSLDMAKELCMIQRTERGKQARQYFLAVEKNWNSPEYEKYQHGGYTKSDTPKFVRQDGTIGCALHTRWTQKGRLFLYELLKKDGILPLIEKDSKAA
jgi:phage anti-repressor protein